MRLVAASISWILGIYLGWLTLSPLHYFLLLSVFLLVLLVAVIWRSKGLALWGGLCLIVLLGGIGCYHWRANEPTLEAFNNRGTVEMRGEVVRDPEFADGVTKLTFSAQEIWVGDEWAEVSGKVLIKTTILPAYSLGELLEVRGELRSLSEVEDSDYRTYLDRQGFCSTLAYPEINFLERGWLFGLRNRLAQSLSSALAEPQASLGEALLLGIRSHIPDSLRSDFYQTGTTHLLAISGFNIAIIGGMVFVGAAWLFGRRRPTYILLGLASVWFYALLTGMQPPVFRAAIMFSLFLVSLWLGRPGSAMPSLTLAAAIMVGISPSVLWDVSFQLSFVAVAGLVLLYPAFRQWGRRVVAREPDAVSSALRPVIDGTALGLAAIVATLPLTVYYFGSISLFALPATILVSLFMPGALLSAAMTAVLGLFAPTLAWFVGWSAWFFLSCMIEVVDGFGSVGFGSLSVGAVHGGWVWGYYVVLVMLISRKQVATVFSRLGGYGRTWLSVLAELTHRLPKKWAVGLLVVSTSLVWVAVLSAPGERLEVSFFDVGEGDAILIETPAGQQILIDGGPDIGGVCLELGKKLPFWDKSLDLVVLTHSDDDHVTGLVEVLRRYEVEQVLETGLSENTPAYDTWLELIDQKGIKRTVAEAGQQIELGDGMVIEVIWPRANPLEGTGSDANNNSVVLRLVWGEVSFLFTGDIEEQAEMEILYSDQWCELNSTVLKVAHHGSARSTSSQFIAAVGPQVAVVSVGVNNYFGHPSDETLARLDGVEVYRTDEHGTITFTTDGERLWMEVVRSE
jgi:competence protein ComEC